MSNVEKQGMTDLPEILNAFEHALELERELGTRTVDCDRALLAPMSAKELKKAQGGQDGQPSLDTKDTPVAKGLEAASHEPRAANRALPTVEELAACTKCPLATLGRQHVVPGQGNANSPDFMFIGEAPGADEDRQGLAFVGAAGQFLTKMIAAMGYAREQIFIANICKCRPPNNRTPSPQEMEACLPYLKRQIAAIRPKCIVLLGRTAMSGLFPTQRIRRGTWYEYEGIPVIATFHPSYIIRFNPTTDAVSLRTAKTEVWNTLKLALAKLGKQPPGR
ncbi:MAG: uracil-DNA glycosylase [Kiritimatiellae bacterium]|nr:uracil-DNA glycosylase [Kiritimatiellia bacterium]